MKNKQPHRISFSYFRELMKEEYRNSVSISVNKNYAMATNAIAGIKSLFNENGPLRLDGVRIGHIKSGEADMMINLMPRHIIKGMLVFLGDNCIIQVNKYSDDFNLEGFAITNDILEIATHGQIPSEMKASMHDIQIIPSEDEVKLFEDILKVLRKITDVIEDNEKMADGIISTLVHYYVYLCKKYQKETVGASPQQREKDIFDRFILLVNRSNGVNRQLSYYAGKMCISQRYLGTVVRHVSGNTAKEWIDRAAVTNVKVLLRHSDMRINEIADKMNFPNDSFFCKYFKRLAGMTPNEYRAGN